MVALLAEGVDRNTEAVLGTWPSNQSPSSRRAWIEIVNVCLVVCTAVGRPPRGGRG